MEHYKLEHHFWNQNPLGEQSKMLPTGVPEQKLFLESGKQGVDVQYKS